jgi:hypothetical protein
MIDIMINIVVKVGVMIEVGIVVQISAVIEIDIVIEIGVAFRIMIAANTDELKASQQDANEQQNGIGQVIPGKEK